MKEIANIVRLLNVADAKRQKVRSYPGDMRVFKEVEKEEDEIYVRFLETWALYTSSSNITVLSIGSGNSDSQRNPAFTKNNSNVTILNIDPKLETVINKRYSSLKGGLSLERFPLSYNFLKKELIKRSKKGKVIISIFTSLSGYTMLLPIQEEQKEGDNIIYMNGYFETLYGVTELQKPFFSLNSEKQREIMDELFSKYCADYGLTPGEYSNHVLSMNRKYGRYIKFHASLDKISSEDLRLNIPPTGEPEPEISQRAKGSFCLIC